MKVKGSCVPKHEFEKVVFMNILVVCNQQQIPWDLPFKVVPSLANLVRQMNCEAHPGESEGAAARWEAFAFIIQGDSHGSSHSKLILV